MLTYVITIPATNICSTFTVMKRQTRLLIFLCAVAVTGLLALQFYWIRSYYNVNQASFEKEANFAFEDALKKEFSLRCDTIQQLIVERLMDSSEFELIGKLREDSVTYKYTTFNKHNKKDQFSISFRDFTLPLIPGDTINKRRVAERLAQSLRSEDLENHIVFYRTQNLGGFVSEKVNQYDFDTARLRPVLTKYLEQRDISVPFSFHLKKFDSTTNKSSFAKELLTKYPVITKSYPTYTFSNDNKYVRAMFTNPFSYIVSQMGFIFFASILLIVIVLLSIFLLLKLLLKEKRLSAIKNDFIGNITHEFKTPIATVSAAVESLSDFDVLQDAEKTKRYLTHSKNELQRLSELVDKLLNISIYENQQLELKPEPINIEEAIQMVTQSHLITAAKKIHFLYENKTAIKNIVADRTHFHHAINNVIDNAIKYSAEKVDIKITCKTKDNFLILEITDNGIGISAKDVPMIFEKFYRVNTANRHPVKGHGLGLTYVKNILERHQGWCKFKSNPGQGSVIFLAWPL